MTPKFSRSISLDIQANLDRIKRKGIALDAYRVAASIQGRNPNDNLALEEIVDELVSRADGIRIVELVPPPTMEVAMIVRPDKLNDGAGSDA